MSEEKVEVEVDVKPATLKVPEGYVVALDGDNYKTIADRLGKGYTAESIWMANLEAPIYPGALVRVK